MSQPGAAQGSIDSDCHALKLTTASGIPDKPTHHYEFAGSCNLIILFKSGPSVMHTLPATATGDWNAASHEFVESFNVTQAVHIPEAHLNRDGATYNIPEMNVTPGLVSSTFVCPNDPLVTDARCVISAHSNASGYPPFSNPANQDRPLLKGKTTLAEGTTLSNVVTTGSGSPASVTVTPPPGSRESSLERGSIRANAGPPNRAAAVPASTAVLLNIEGEDLVRDGKFQLRGGEVTIQPMSGFGSGWSNDAQLFWSGGTVGAVLDILVDIPAAATYALELYPTRAPDYAQLQIRVDDQDAPDRVEGYSPRVMPPAPRQIGRYSLSAGEHKLSFMIVGRNAMATGYLAGIDRIRLYPSGPP